ncbi:M3 family metallopeptidase [Porphyromonas sp. COT-239 OH1446]|uniref:M3 family metallopeptidase n=1 Tax=Porphyromonas sp. COT-239 OH1446 TaxID=1515613 RepID=UPI00052E3A32|nr:M3 family metallopeptidase [Porphyromonas sp. COT-239 OH1446]KGN68066.1 peptidase M3 [Porphyromonas sp. COT-239 OH1446]
MNQTNPILLPYDTPHGAYPFDRIDIEHYREAFAEALKIKRAEVDAIINNPEPPTFDNTILALERCGDAMERVSGIFFNLLHAHANDELMQISEEIIPQMSELSTYIILNEALFERIHSVYQERESLGLDEEEQRLLQNCYEGFAESGATLPEVQKQRLRELSQELSRSGLLFGQNTLKDQKRYRLYLSDESEVKGMPESSLLMAREAAEREGHPTGWLFDLSAPSYFPFMQHCPVGERRREMYLAKMAIGAAGDEYDNREHIRSLVNGRLEEAQLLGYETFAHLALHKRMAKHPSAVYELLDKLLDAYKPVAEREIEQVRRFALERGVETELQSWDWSYWAEQYKQAYYELDDELLRPYFELSRVIEAVLGLATQLYGLGFEERGDIPVYHPDVKVFEVKDEDGSYLGLLYTDFFPREGKQSGAWMNNLQEQYHLESGEDHRPHIVLVMNFTPPTAERPSLLTVGEVHTFLHEFGHALHGLLSQCRFSSLSGTGVARDFVELPSQIMENWLSEPEWLTSFARHYQSGEAIPSEYIDRMQRARHFLVGYAACRQLSFGYLDMAWHTLREPLGEALDVRAFEDEAWHKALVLPPASEGAIMSTSFGHIFSGGYSAGYYGYKWAEVLDADAFSLFKQHGIFSREVAQRFRREILSQGDKREAMDLYESFRGAKPSIDALLRRDGILPLEA